MYWPIVILVLGTVSLTICIALMMLDKERLSGVAMLIGIALIFTFLVTGILIVHSPRHAAEIHCSRIEYVDVEYREEGDYLTIALQDGVEVREPIGSCTIYTVPGQ